MENCLFCKIIHGEIPSARVYEDEKTYAFRDIAPMAPTHVLVVPKAHVSGMSGIDDADDATLAACLRAVKKVAELEQLDGGFRTVSNCGKDACQSVNHLHFHVLGGKQLSEKMD
ncbi:MAG: histidine triad nucleotide-binding protein [Clostridiales bacterium]|nr:histidine triad nucleotide-binding protein [Clostridiales bacterium]